MWGPTDVYSQVYLWETTKLTGHLSLPAVSEVEAFRAHLKKLNVYQF